MRRLLPLLLLLVLLAPTTAYAVPHYSQAYSTSAIRHEAHDAHYGLTQTNALLHLARHESNTHNWSSNHGHYLGLFQLHNTMCSRWWYSPYYNTRRAIRYIKHRYGTPTRALSHYHRYSWY